MKMKEIIIYCADIGSIKNNNFGWCRGYNSKFDEGTDIIEFSSRISKDLSEGKMVALGFECPLFVPISKNPLFLTAARQGEGDRAWSAGAGCGALSTGLTESVFILNEIKKHSTQKVTPTFNWNYFINDNANLFIWEAFITKEAKVTSHSGDAKVTVMSFEKSLPNIEEANSILVDNSYNLVAAAILRVGLSENINLLCETCIVIKS